MLFAVNTRKDHELWWRMQAEYQVGICANLSLYIYSIGSGIMMRHTEFNLGCLTEIQAEISPDWNMDLEKAEVLLEIERLQNQNHEDELRREQRYN